MDIPPSEASCWTDLLTGTSTPPCRHLGVQMMIFRLRQAVARDTTTAMPLAQAASELHGFFTANIQLPSVQQDLAAIRGATP